MEPPADGLNDIGQSGKASVLKRKGKNSLKKIPGLAQMKQMNLQSSPFYGGNNELQKLNHVEKKGQKNTSLPSLRIGRGRTLKALQPSTIQASRRFCPKSSSFGEDPLTINVPNNNNGDSGNSLSNSDSNNSSVFPYPSRNQLSVSDHRLRPSKSFGTKQLNGRKLQSSKSFGSIRSRMHSLSFDRSMKGSRSSNIFREGDRDLSNSEDSTDKSTLIDSIGIEWENGELGPGRSVTNLKRVVTMTPRTGQNVYNKTREHINSFEYGELRPHTRGTINAEQSKKSNSFSFNLPISSRKPSLGRSATLLPPTGLMGSTESMKKSKSLSSCPIGGLRRTASLLPSRTMTRLGANGFMAKSNSFSGNLRRTSSIMGPDDLRAPLNSYKNIRGRVSKGGVSLLKRAQTSLPKKSRRISQDADRLDRLAPSIKNKFTFKLSRSSATAGKISFGRPQPQEKSQDMTEKEQEGNEEDNNEERKIQNPGEVLTPRVQKKEWESQERSTFSDEIARFECGPLYKELRRRQLKYGTEKDQLEFIANAAKLYLKGST